MQGPDSLENYRQPGSPLLTSQSDQVISSGYAVYVLVCRCSNFGYGPVEHDEEETSGY